MHAATFFEAELIAAHRYEVHECEPAQMTGRQQRLLNHLQKPGSKKIAQEHKVVLLYFYYTSSTNFFANMKPQKTTLFIILFVLQGICVRSVAQYNDSSLLLKTWAAHWIVPADAALKDYGVFIFRKSFTLAGKPSSFIVHVSADNRYKLFVNGTIVSIGPARGDFFHWNFETIDISAQLKSGTNTIAALVWNEGEARPEAQITHITSFILYGNSAAEKVVNTDAGWRCIQDSSYQPLAVHVKGYYAAGAGELTDMNKQEKNWEQDTFDDSKWKAAVNYTPGLPKGVFSYHYSWMLQPSPIPQMEMKVVRLQSARQADGVKAPEQWPAVKGVVTIPANTNATILLDQAYLINAYPTLAFGGGKDAGISLSYAEALYEKGNDKGNRNDVERKMFIGKKDSIISDGSASQSFTSLWWRTYRYLQLKVHTKNDPLVINDLYGTFTGYPFTMNARFNAGDTSLQKMLDIGWRTARLCANETYMDCPYYEQLQYIGDTRIQALVSFYNSGDDRLVRNALTLLDHSRMAEGITLSRYPTANPQEIPFFSLWYIGMLHDFWMYRADTNFVKEKLPGVREVLNFFSRYQQANGSLKNVPYWTFSDWVETNGWQNGMAPLGNDGSSAVLDLQLLWAYQVAAEMEYRTGMKEYADMYSKAANLLKTTIRQKYWDQQKSLFADTPEKDLFSQHANALAILTHTIVGKEATNLARKIIADSTLAPASIYFKYYLHQACIKAGLGDDYLQWLGKWRENMQLGLTTWAEMSDVRNSRSDCHAWGSSPNIELYRTVLGIDSDAPGFTSVIITPHLGSLTSASGEMPHPNGKILVAYKKTASLWNMNIMLPKNTTGSFVWKGKMYALKAGANNLNL